MRRALAAVFPAGEWTAKAVRALFVTFVVVVLAMGLMSACEQGFGTAESYCHGIYDNGGSTPGWAAREGAFSDYDSCVEWYAAAKESARDW